VIKTRYTVFKNQLFNTVFSGISFTTIYEKRCKAAPPPTASLQTDTGTDRQRNNNRLYCGYCDVQCKTVDDLVKHCKCDPHKCAVFADSGRDVLWQFEPPPIKDDISPAVHG